MKWVKYMQYVVFIDVNNTCQQQNLLQMAGKGLNGAMFSQLHFCNHKINNLLLGLWALAGLYVIELKKSAQQKSTLFECKENILVDLGDVYIVLTKSFWEIIYTPIKFKHTNSTLDIIKYILANFWECCGGWWPPHSGLLWGVIARQLFLHTFRLFLTIWNHMYLIHRITN